jgi:hypothetical protein
MWWVVVGSVLVLAYDLVTAAATVAMGWEYSGPLGLAGSVAVHAVAPLLAARSTGSVRLAVMVGAVVGAVDATLGWAVVAALFHVAVPAGPPDPGLTLLTVALVTLMFAGVGWVAGMVGLRLRRVST